MDLKSMAQLSSDRQAHVVYTLLQYILMGYVAKNHTNLNIEEDPILKQLGCSNWTNYIAEFLNNDFSSKDFEKIIHPLEQIHKILKTSVDETVDGELFCVQRSKTINLSLGSKYGDISMDAIYYRAQSDFYDSKIPMYLDRLHIDTRKQLYLINRSKPQRKLENKNWTNRYKKVINLIIKQEVTSTTVKTLTSLVKRNKGFQRAITVNAKNAKQTLAILNFFCDEIARKYPQEQVSFMIKQDGDILTLIIKTPTGDYEFIKRELKNYESVLKRKTPVETFFANEEDAMMAKFLFKAYSRACGEMEYKETRLLSAIAGLSGNEPQKSSSLTPLLIQMSEAQDERNKEFLVELSKLLQQNTQQSLVQAQELMNSMQSSNSALAENVKQVVINSLGATAGSIVSGPLGALFTAMP